MIRWLIVISLFICLALVFTAIVLMIAGIYKKYKGTDTALIWYGAIMLVVGIVATIASIFLTYMMLIATDWGQALY